MANKAELQELTKTIMEFKNLYKTTIKEMRDDFSQLRNDLVTLTSDLTAARKDINELKTRVEKIEKEGPKESNTLLATSAQVNALEQRNIDTQLSILNVPSKLEINNILSSLSAWSKMQLDENAFKRAVLVSSKNKSKENTSTLQLDFGSIINKSRFMKHVKSLQKDEQKKYIPILTESIFDIQPTDPARGKELQFRDQFTEVNKQIFNQAKKHKTVFKAVWKNSGYINVKCEPELKPIRILSIDHLNKLIESKQN